MATQVQFRGGTTTEHASFNGAAREVTVDTTKQTLVVQDGTTNGGFPLLRENGTQSLTTTGDIFIDSNSSKLKLGDAGELECFHDGSNSYLKNTLTNGDLILDSAQNFYIKHAGETQIQCVNDGSVTLYHDGATLPDFETTADGPAISSQGADISRLRFLTDSHATTKIGYYGLSSKFGMDINGGFEIRDAGNSYETMFRAVPNGAVQLFFDGDTNPKLATNATGVDVTGVMQCDEFKLLDNEHAKFGTGEHFRLFHDGTNGNIKSTSGHLNVYLPTGKSFSIGNSDFSEDIFRATEGGSLQLYNASNLRFETTNVGATLTGRLSNYYDASIVAGLYLRNSNDTGTAVQFVKNDGSVVGSISQTASATSYNTSSDYRLKENKVAISDGITRLKTLKPYRFNFKVDPDTTVDGFFAHEVTAVPEAITGEKDGTEMQGIDQSKLVPLLTAALQEAITKIETLETKVAALEAG